MTFISKNEPITSEMPISPYLKLFTAEVTCLGSPTDFISLSDPTMNMMRAVSPENAKRALRKFAKTTGIQEIVATSPDRHPPHDSEISNIIKD